MTNVRVNKMVLRREEAAMSRVTRLHPFSGTPDTIQGRPFLDTAPLASALRGPANRSCQLHYVACDSRHDALPVEAHYSVGWTPLLSDANVRFDRICHLVL